MQTQCPPEQKSNRVGELFRSIVERLARLVMHEPFILIPKRQAERLRQLERREELRLAERGGDDEFLDRELAKAQLTAHDLAQSTDRITPITQWPDEEFADCLGDPAESQEKRGAGI